MPMRNEPEVLMSDRRRFLLTALVAVPIALPGLVFGQTDAILHQAIDSDIRSAHDRARDVYRHPQDRSASGG